MASVKLGQSVGEETTTVAKETNIEAEVGKAPRLLLGRIENCRDFCERWEHADFEDADQEACGMKLA